MCHFVYQKYECGIAEIASECDADCGRFDGVSEGHSAGGV